eukprot:119700-Amphidinium_carterae.2
MFWEGALNIIVRSFVAARAYWTKSDPSVKTSKSPSTSKDSTESTEAAPSALQGTSKCWLGNRSNYFSLVSFFSACNAVWSTFYRTTWTMVRVET